MTGRLTDSTPFVMSESEAESLFRRYLEFITGDSASSMSEILAEDFLDHVSGQRGNGIWDMVDEWRRATFADAETEIHELMTRDDRVLVWSTLTATHIGGGFPRLRNIPVSNKRVAWPQVHVFRIADGLLAEHWAVRDDYALVEAIVGRGPLAPPPAS